MSAFTSSVALAGAVAVVGAGAGTGPAVREHVKVLVVGSTGYLGGKVVDRLLRKNCYQVRALIRPSTATDDFLQRYPDVQVVRGDMMDPISLASALSGMDVVITTAAGYMRRQSGDSIKTDIEGNRHLVDAAKNAHIQQFIFCSILNCTDNECAHIPHFAAKGITEKYLADQHVPYTALRPGAFLAPTIFPALTRGYLLGMWDPNVKLTFVNVDDVARCLVESIDQPDALNQSIDIGSDRPVTYYELGQIIGKILNKTVSVYRLPRFIFSFFSWFSPFMSDILSMADYFNRGTYIANTNVQAQLFPPVRTVEEGTRDLLLEMQLIPNTTTV